MADEHDDTQFGESVTAVNRTKGELRCQWDGAHYRFKPGKNHGVPINVALAACRQNPLMGSEHPYDPMEYESLMGIVGHSRFGDCSPTTQNDAAGERVDRKRWAGVENAKARNAGGPTYFDGMAGVNVDTSADTITR